MASTSLPAELTLSIVARISEALQVSSRLEESVRARYMSRVDFQSLVSGIAQPVDSEIIMTSIDSIQVKDDIKPDRWKIAFRALLTELAKFSTSDRTLTRPGSNATKSTSQKNGVGSKVTPSERAGLGRPSPPTKLNLALSVASESDYRALFDYLQVTDFPFRTGYHDRYIKCGVKKCGFCIQLFMHTDVTSCGRYKHPPCHPCGFYPHIGLHLWKQVKMSHNAREEYRSSGNRNLKYTLAGRILPPSLELTQKRCHDQEPMVVEEQPKVQCTDGTVITIASPDYRNESPTY